MPRAALYIYTAKECNNYNDPFRSGKVVLTTIAASNDSYSVVQYR